ncbi:MAG: NAD(P)-binding domain-containing protein [Verrucomicrobiales bacterium]|nr:NAD(P)-binding domain-containing protein [Verrucomicrobiales bacterium]
MIQHRTSSPNTQDVIIVGAGPAGLGCAAALKECGIENILTLDRREVGAAFSSWPAQMRMISPSFHSNPFGQPDLNAITPHTSPADYLHSEHPTGPEYAKYLQAVSTYYELNIQTGITVSAVEKSIGGLEVRTGEKTFYAQHVIWAAGEFFFPNDNEIRGREYCLHNSEVEDWKNLPGVEHAVIGGFESGIDAAIHLARAGKSVHLLSRGEPWHHDSTDPSRMLSPFTRDRLKDVFLTAPGTIRFYRDADIVEVVKQGQDYLILDREGEPFEISTPPILCTGFNGGLGPVASHFTDDDGQLSFTEEADESPTLPGLFYSGPMLQHRQSIFCFIYKYRGRFGIIAREIAERLGREWEAPLRQWQERGFLIEDLDCCTDCTCAVENEHETAPAAVEDYAGAIR